MQKYETKKKLLKAFKIFRYFMAERVGTISRVCHVRVGGEFRAFKIIDFHSMGTTEKQFKPAERYYISVPFENRLKYALLSNACLFSPFGKWYVSGWGGWMIGENFCFLFFRCRMTWNIENQRKFPALFHVQRNVDP